MKQTLYYPKNGGYLRNDGLKHSDGSIAFIPAFDSIEDMINEFPSSGDDYGIVYPDTGE